MLYPYENIGRQRVNLVQRQQLQLPAEVREVITVAAAMSSLLTIIIINYNNNNFDAALQSCRSA